MLRSLQRYEDSIYANSAVAQVFYLSTGCLSFDHGACLYQHVQMQKCGKRLYRNHAIQMKLQIKETN
jgi:hypothetical protein